MQRLTVRCAPRTAVPVDVRWAPERPDRRRREQPVPVGLVELSRRCSVGRAWVEPLVPAGSLAACAACLLLLARTCARRRRAFPRLARAILWRRAVPSASKGELPPSDELRAAKRNLLFDDGPRKQLVDAIIPRDAPCLVFMAYGVCLSATNVAGALGIWASRDDYDQLLGLGVALGFASTTAGVLQAWFDKDLADSRPGMARETSIVLFYALWGLACVLLCARVGAGHGGIPLAGDNWLLDLALCGLCCAAFLYGFWSPVATRIEHQSGLTELEMTRMQGLAQCGFFGVVYILDAGAFAVKGAAWWARVVEAWPGQRACEQTTLLCGALAVEGCMLLHRLGREGVFRFRGEAIPAGLALSLLLTALPTITQIVWQRSQISLWEFYFV